MIHIKYAFDIQCILILCFVFITGKSCREYFIAVLDASENNVCITYIYSQDHVLPPKR